jgi:hypothetical protein
MLSAEDCAHLEKYESRLGLVRDLVRGVAEGWKTGLYLWGGGGTSKTHTVCEHLKQLGAHWKLTNSRLTGRGLFDLLDEYRDIVHVLEDMERLCLDANAAGVLRSALWAQKGEKDEQHRPRLVTWRAHKTKLEVLFRGGIILIQNRPLDDLPELRALKTRIAYLHLQPTNEEIIAKMRAIAAEGYAHGDGTLTPEECGEVCEHVVRRCLDTGRNLQIRVLINAFHDRLQDEAGHADSTWQDLVESQLLEEAMARPPATERRAERIARERGIALEINQMALSSAEKQRLWTERTGNCGRGFWRRLRE